MKELTIKLRRPHPAQARFIDSPAKRKVIRAGRRGGKTTGVATLAIKRFLAGGRVLYGVPTDEQVDRFWKEVKRALEQPLDAGIFYKNETKHIIERAGTEQRIRAKTAWDADTLRGDYADLLILDEYQLMKASKDNPAVSEAWNDVGAPMLLDNDGDAVFIFTGKRGKHHSKELYKRAEEDTTGRWEVFRFASHDNPHLSRTALDEITQDMTNLSYRSEILAEDIDDDPRALWNRGIIDHVTSHPYLVRVGVGVDPPGTEGGAECGIVIAGVAQVGQEIHGYVIGDRSLQGSPAKWGGEAVTAYNLHKADRLVGEVNNGGDMVEHTIRTVEDGKDVAYKAVRASRGKAIRAEPVSALYEKGRIHHVGVFEDLEDQMCNWVPGAKSPDRLDALVWVLTELMLAKPKKKAGTWRR